MVQVQSFGTGPRYKLEILHQSVERVKNKSQKVLGANSYVCPPPILNRVKVAASLNHTLCYDLNLARQYGHIKEIGYCNHDKFTVS